MASFDSSTVNSIHNLVCEIDSPFEEVAVLPGERKMRYALWYDRILSSLALIVGEGEALFGHGAYDPKTSTGRIFLITDRLATLVTIKQVNADKAECEISAFSRSSITSIALESETGVSAEGRQSRTWPGDVTLTIRYDSIQEPVVVHALGYDKFDQAKTAPVLVLLNTVREDLAAKR